MSDTPINFNTPEAKIAKEVAYQLIQKKTGKNIKNQQIRKETELMMRLVEEIEIKHELFLSNMCKRLNLNTENAQSMFHTIAEEIFSDGINWGRIIVLYAFAGKIAEHCRKSNDEQIIDKIALWVAGFVAKKSSWIRDSGRGWNGFIENFDVKQDSWVQGLFAATLGLGTIAAALYIKS
ncbi:uncharacterized protein LOC100215682 [Hydra vulgaris]|uniref:Bcl-2 n=1 Tax=Hydra vulgaris TaxID=6087 RepID=A1E3K7_HYDVU|nr:uncharacterized protein LOC100215682 [Hydra vulgaris]XP_047139329.1 uncharacterized protein LOC100215682 isoform X1 [Hydra vulgaris]ABL01494.1 bcl-2 [Hydra vulgaris]